MLSLIDRASGADALWVRRNHAPAVCSRVLGSPGADSIASFIDVFVGGWFGMFPLVGYPQRNQPAQLLHGELVRLPWRTIKESDTFVEADVRCVRSPFAVVRRVEIAGSMMSVSERIENIGSAPAPFLWGHHPCFSRETFAGGQIKIELHAADVPYPHYDEAHARFASGPITWPHGRLRDGGAIELDVIPQVADRRHDHVQLTPKTGHFQLTAPRFGRMLTCRWDIDCFPHLLLWQDFQGQDGYPFWGDGDTFALEMSTNPGRSGDDAAAADAFRWLEPGEAVSTRLSVEWSDSPQ